MEKVVGLSSGDVLKLKMNLSGEGFSFSGAAAANADDLLTLLAGYKSDLVSMAALLTSSKALEWKNSYSRETFPFDSATSDFRRIVLDPMTSSERSEFSNGISGIYYISAVAKRVDIYMKYLHLLKEEGIVSGKTLRAAGEATIEAARQAPEGLEGETAKILREELQKVESTVKGYLSNVPDTGELTPIYSNRDSGESRTTSPGGANNVVSTIPAKPPIEIERQARIAQALTAQAALDGTVAPVTGEFTEIDWNNRQADGSPTITVTPSVPWPTDVSFGAANLNSPADSAEAHIPSDLEWAPLNQISPSLVEPSSEPWAQRPRSYMQFRDPGTIGETIEQNLARLRREAEEHDRVPLHFYLNPFWMMRQAKDWAKERWQGIKNDFHEYGKENFPFLVDEPLIPEQKSR